MTVTQVDTETIREAVGRLLAAARVSEPPVDLVRLAKLQGITSIRHRKMKSTLGMVKEGNDGSLTMLLNSRQPLRERFTMQRYASTPLETFGVVAAYDRGMDAYEIWTNDQRPGLTISVVAASLGVPVRRVYSMTFAFGVALAGLSGVLLAPVYSVFPTLGKDFILMAFTAVIVGGLGSIRGVVIAGLGLTQIQAVSSLYISPVWGEPLVFGIMVLVLMVRPQGIFGGKLGHA